MPTDREKSEEAKERANNKSTSQFDIAESEFVDYVEGRR